MELASQKDIEVQRSTVLEMELFSAKGQYNSSKYEELTVLEKTLPVLQSRIDELETDQKINSRESSDLKNLAKKLLDENIELKANISKMLDGQPSSISQIATLSQSPKMQVLTSVDHTSELSELIQIKANMQRFGDIVRIREEAFRRAVAERDTELARLITQLGASSSLPNQIPVPPSGLNFQYESHHSPNQEEINQQAITMSFGVMRETPPPLSEEDSSNHHEQSMGVYQVCGSSVLNRKSSHNRDRSNGKRKRRYIKYYGGSSLTPQDSLTLNQILDLNDAPNSKNLVSQYNLKALIKSSELDKKTHVFKEGISEIKKEGTDTTIQAFISRVNQRLKENYNAEQGSMPQVGYRNEAQNGQRREGNYNSNEMSFGEATSVSQATWPNREETPSQRESDIPSLNQAITRQNNQTGPVQAFTSSVVDSSIIINSSKNVINDRLPVSNTVIVSQGQAPQEFATQVNPGKVIRKTSSMVQGGQSLTSRSEEQQNNLSFRPHEIENHRTTVIQNGKLPVDTVSQSGKDLRAVQTNASLNAFEKVKNQSVYPTPISSYNSQPISSIYSAQPQITTTYPSEKRSLGYTDAANSSTTSYPIRQVSLSPPPNYNNPQPVYSNHIAQSANQVISEHHNPAVRPSNISTPTNLINLSRSVSISPPPHVIPPTLSHIIRQSSTSPPPLVANNADSYNYHQQTVQIRSTDSAFHTPRLIETHQHFSSSQYDREFSPSVVNISPLVKTVNTMGVPQVFRGSNISQRYTGLPVEAGRSSPSVISPIASAPSTLRDHLDNITRPDGHMVIVAPPHISTAPVVIRASQALNLEGRTPNNSNQISKTGPIFTNASQGAATRSQANLTLPPSNTNVNLAQSSQPWEANLAPLSGQSAVTYGGITNNQTSKSIDRSRQPPVPTQSTSPVQQYGSLDNRDGRGARFMEDRNNSLEYSRDISYLTSTPRASLDIGSQVLGSIDPSQEQRLS